MADYEDEYASSLPRTSVPEIILEEQFAEELCDVYDKESLEYYPEDDILLTEDGELVDRRGILVGNMWEQCVKDGETEVYVRNAGYGCDFQIVVRQGLGMDHINPEY